MFAFIGFLLECLKSLSDPDHIVEMYRKKVPTFFSSSIFSPLGRSCKSLDFAWMSIIKETFQNVNNFDCNADECCPEA